MNWNRLLRSSVVAAGLLTLGLLIAISGRIVMRDWRSVEGSGSGHSRLLVPVPCQVAEGVYLLGDMFPSAVYVIDTGSGLVMVDSGLEAEYDKLIDGLSQLALDIRQLKLILLTHAHGDHTMGAERLRRETKAKVCIGKEDAGPLRDGGPLEAIYSKFDLPRAGIHRATVDEELVDGQVLSLGEAQITAIATPGHTPGSICYLLQLHDRRIIFSGDTLMTLTSNLGTYAADLSPQYRGSANDYLASLKKLRRLAAPDLLLPGHPQVDPTPQDPHLGEDQWAALLDGGIYELEQSISRFARDGEDFLDGTPKRLVEGLFYLGDLNGRAVYAYLTEAHAFLFDAARGTAPAEFIEGAWKQLRVAPPPTAALFLTSCAPDNIAGIGAFLDATNCPVVASPAGIDAIRNCGARQLLSTDEIAASGWEGLEALAVPGLYDTAVAYRFQIGSTRVLVSGEIPIDTYDVDYIVFGDPVSFMRRRLPDQPPRPDRFISSLQELAKWPPNLWLSGRPAHGRNANLYGQDWPRILRGNQGLARQLQVTRGTTATSN